MRRKRKPVPGFPPHLVAFRPAGWVDEYQWRLARWDYWRSHPELHAHVDPVLLLRERREARRAAA